MCFPFKNNIFVILNSVKEELENHLNFKTESITDFCSKHKHFNKDEIIATLKKRYDNLIKKYHTRQEEKRYDLSKVENFYSNYLGNLYEITLDKLGNRKLSKKLKKLADREGLLPEEGDLKLLCDAIQLRKLNPNVAILSNDKDLYMFNKKIEEEFQIRVYK